MDRLSTLGDPAGRGRASRVGPVRAHSFGSRGGSPTCDSPGRGRSLGRSTAVALLAAVAPFATLALLATVALGACNRDEPAGHTRERVNAVRTTRASAAPDDICDVVPARDASAFAWPTLATQPPATRPGRWLWVNVWATWCEPCVEELPRLAAWSELLGERVTLRLVSADTSEEAVEGYRAGHPDLPASLRLADPEAVAEWLTRLGVPGASLPVHIFVDPAGQVRCVRASSLADHDLPALRALLRGD